ncbi:hypothetical protein MCOR02_003472 [Pyricularia oryzae]|uniref:Uncharacterized protein n=1 Tax=Pyricularia oryzae TaxID=318829 RepID=A0A4P7N566_PYROR|nr:hypothetical protein MCOR02_003472 [Pyricularia oryzae]KAI6472401.1 hypothetical protein MCOR17_002884 [Pyricularia oryzae]KAI6602841.1 hypothetical protein MCOR04_001911 [Pyricularia oryzae]KAI6643496.1 hypothetical protein MCOR14_002061 [Pyricularia oryzae]QBZ57669.1 hypothetical protein PoMZ_02603 [Pyricularia oryzae]
MDDRLSHPQPSDPLAIFNVRAAQPDSCGYVGGWSLRVPSPGHCPAKASKPCGTGVQLRCCPPDLECRGADDYFGCYCCLPGEDCVPRVLEKPKCPTSEWSQWAINGTFEIGGFCCLPGLKGISIRLANNTFGFGCASPDATLAEYEGWAVEMPPSPCARVDSPASTTSPTGGLATSGRANDGLTSGRIAGLVVGVILGVALVVAGAWFVLRKRRKSTGCGGDASKDGDSVVKTLAGTAAAGAAWPAERHFSQASTAVPHEMESQRWAHEMEDRSTVMPPELPPITSTWRHNPDYEFVVVPSSTHSSTVSPLNRMGASPRGMPPT